MTIAERLADAAGALEHWQHERDALIRRMRDEGASLRQIAEAADLSPAGVKKILDRG